MFGKTSGGFNLSNYISLELSILNGTSKGGLTFISIDSYLNLLPQKKINPFIIVGGGAGIVDRGGKTSTEGLLSGGAGVQQFLTEDLAIRFELRSYALIGGKSNRGQAEWAGSIGLVFYFDPAYDSALTSQPVAALQDKVGVDKEKPASQIQVKEMPKEAILQFKIKNLAGGYGERTDDRSSKGRV